MPPKKKGGLSKKKRLSVFEIQYIEKGISCLADTNNWLYPLAFDAAIAT